MALSNQSPLRPYVKLSQLMPDGRYVKDRKNIYKIPYNYVSEFNITYADKGVGQVKLVLFDIEYDWILDGLLSQVYMNNGSPSINFILEFGWEDSNSTDVLGAIWPTGNSAQDPPKEYLNKYTGQKSQGRQPYATHKRLQSEPHIVIFDTIELKLTEVGFELHLSGFNTFSANFKLFSNIDKAYQGYPWEILDSIAKDADIEIDWKVDEKEFDYKNSIKYDTNKFCCSNRLIGDVMSSLVSSIYIDGSPDQVSYFVDSLYDVGNRMKARVVIFKKAQHTEQATFLGKFDYFSGKNSPIVDTIDFKIPNLISFFSHEIDSKSLDAGNKSTSEPTTGPQNNANINASKDKLDRYPAKSNESEEYRTTEKMGSAPKGTSYDTEQFAKLKHYFQDSLQNYTMTADLNIIGDPTIDFYDLKTQSFLELNIHKKDGMLVNYLSGTYTIDSITHAISNSDFITSLALTKWKFLYTEETKAKGL